MAKLYFYYASMNAGKSTALLQADYNYRERGMRTLLFTAAVDTRHGPGRIASRVSIAREAATFAPGTDLFARADDAHRAAPLACVLVDEAQFLAEPQVDQLARVADLLGVPVLAYGLRTDFLGRLFAGSARLLAVADVLAEIKSVCLCGRKATFTARVGADGRALTDGAQTEIGGNDRYVALCRRHHGQALAGTLDPLASGVLPVALGEATKLAGRLLDSDKLYAFTVAFGVETDTLDAEGQVIATSDVRPAPAALAAVLSHFTGPIAQMPPAFSAIKVDGRRAYDRARAGETVTLAARAVTVHALEILPGEDENGATLLAHVSKGTYIRSLARDIARALGTVGHVSMLRRLKAGPFTLESAISLDKLTELGHARALETALLPLSAGLDDIPALALTPDQAGQLRLGRTLIGTAADDGLCLAMLDTVPVALAEVQDGVVRVVRGFNL